GAGVITLKMKQKIIQLHLNGVSERKIASQTKKARNTVRKYIKQFKQSKQEDVQDLPITEEVLRPPTYKKRKGKKKDLTDEIKAKIKPKQKKKEKKYIKILSSLKKVNRKMYKIYRLQKRFFDLQLTRKGKENKRS